MVVTLKLISTAVCYQDGLARPEVRTSLAPEAMRILFVQCTGSLLPVVALSSVSSRAIQGVAVATGVEQHA